METNSKNMKFTHLVVFDGTSAYVIPAEDIVQEFEQSEVEVLERFTDLDVASIFCDKQNEIIRDKF